LVLLICFSVVALPLDLLHNHNDEIQCSDYGQTGNCTHKIHISKKGSFCFACAFHIDKTFLAPSNEQQTEDIAWIRIFSENKVVSIVIEPILILLRGPPSR
jgi:hypothetical protein